MFQILKVKFDSLQFQFIVIQFRIILFLLCLDTLPLLYDIHECRLGAFRQFHDAPDEVLLDRRPNAHDKHQKKQRLQSFLRFTLCHLHQIHRVKGTRRDQLQRVSNVIIKLVVDIAQTVVIVLPFIRTRVSRKMEALNLDEHLLYQTAVPYLCDAIDARVLCDFLQPQKKRLCLAFHYKYKRNQLNNNYVDKKMVQSFFFSSLSTYL